MKALTTTVARYLYAIPFVIFGLFHFMNAGKMAPMVPLPGGVFWIYLTGLGLVAAGISIIIQKRAKLAALLLGIMLLIFILTIHLPGLMNEATMQTSMMNLLKDMALMGAAFTYSGLATD